MRAILALLLLLQATSDEKDFRARLEEKKSRAQERLAEAKAELAEERKAAEEAAEALRRRMAAKPLDITLRSAAIHKQALVRRFSFSDVEIESGGKTISLPWDLVSTESTLAAAGAIFDPADAGKQFEGGRFLIARRLWKEAREAFQRAVKLDGGYEARVDDVREVLDRLVAGQGTFGGAARRLGLDTLSLTYDFKDARQLQDFSHGLTLSGGAAVLETKTKQLLLLRGAGSNAPLEFLDAVSVDMKVTADVPLVLELFYGAKEGYDVEVSPDGVALYRAEPKAGSAEPQRKLIAKSDKVKLTKGKAQDLSLTARDRKFKIHIDRKEALAAEVPRASAEEGPLRGAFLMGIEKGKATIAAPLVIQGRMDAGDLQKRFAEVEVLVRRAIDPDLKDIEEARAREMANELLGPKGAGLTTSADDPFFIYRIKAYADISKYGDLRRMLQALLSKGGSHAEAKKILDDLAGRYADVPSLFYGRALIHQERQEVPAARADIEKALRLFPEFAEALVTEAQIHLGEGNPEKGLASIERALTAKSDYASAYLLRAMAAFSKDPSKESAWLEDLRLAVKLEPSNREAATLLRSLRYAARGPKDLGCLHEFQSPHYRIVTDISLDAAKLYGEHLEAAYRHFSETFKRLRQERPFPKPRVAIFNTAENYYTYYELLSENRGEWTGGAFRRFFNELVLFESADLDATLHTLYHEAFHHFTVLLTERTLPYWYNEGIAEYMGGIRVKDGKMAEKALILKGRLQDLQMMMSFGISFPFEKIMTETPTEFYSGATGLKYAQAWSMVHFFHEHAGGKHRPLIDKYFDALRGGASAQEAYDQVFKPQAAELEKEWKEYVTKMKP